MAISPPIVRVRLDGGILPIADDTLAVRYALAADEFEGGANEAASSRCAS
jgi:hypothetical protein